MPAILPFLPTIIGAAGSIGGGLLAKKSGMGGPSPQQKGLMDQAAANSKLSSSWASNLFPQGQSLLDSSKSTFQVPLDFWKGIAGGTRTGATSILAPEIQRIQEGESAAGRTAASLFPRSGASSTFKLDSIFAPQRAISTLLQTARPNAMANLSDLAGKFSEIGRGLTGQAGSLLSSSTAGANATLAELLQQQKNQQEQQGAFGKAIGGILADLTRGLIKSKGGGSRGGCWVIQALYGKNTFKTIFLWSWITSNYGWSRSKTGRIFTRVYMVIGRLVAWLVRYGIFSIPCNWLFNRLYDKAMQDTVWINSWSKEA